MRLLRPDRCGVRVGVGLVAWALALPLAAQEKSIKPGINRPYEKPDVSGQVKSLEGTTREVVKRQDEIVALCELKPGMNVADIGAGTGLFTRLFARKVAPGGKVFAVEISRRFIEHIEKTCQEQKISNVVGVLCPPTSTNLAPQSIDLAFVCDTYHHLEFPQKTLASMHEALRPGGRLVLVEYHKAGKMQDHVRADQETFLKEIVAGGFRLLDEPKFSESQYVLRFARSSLRAPATPLVVHDPYFSIWSFADRLADEWPRHWIGTTHALCSMVRIDNRAYRLMGPVSGDVPAARQVDRQVLPTRTLYEFEAGGVRLRLTFTTPVLPHDLDLVGRPVTYLTWEAWSSDGKQHAVDIYYDNSAELVVNEAKQPVVWSRPSVPGLTVMRMGSKDQPVLEKKGDNLRIDWGYAYVAIPSEAGRWTTWIAAADAARKAFLAQGQLPSGSSAKDPPPDDTKMPRPANQDWPVTACACSLGQVGANKQACWLMLAYDDEYSIEYLGTRLRPYWRRKGMEAAGLLTTAAAQYATLRRQCEQFDEEFMADLARVGGPDYADFCALAYREALGGHKLVAGPKGEPMLFPKENFSNGCIGTVDVIYPAAPIFALLNKELLKATLTPVLDYAMSPRWKFPFAPHDLGTYPKANGQVYGGGEKTEENQMPVEESGNMLILAALVCKLDGNTEYVERYWRLWEQWAKYLNEKGLDPAHQLCTDDFAGHLAHNANLSLKAILALGAYAQMCEMAGKRQQAEQYRRTAEQFAKQWLKLADDGDHFRLAFDKPGTWSQKYNLVWDKLLGLKLFAPEVARKEIAFYKTKLNPFGLPLDNRAVYTKTDWEVWTATLADSRADFDSLMRPVYQFVRQTPDRVPMTDWYMTDTAKLKGFRARPVIGGVFIKMLDDPAVWKKWLSWKPRPHEAQTTKSLSPKRGSDDCFVGFRRGAPLVFGLGS